MFDAKLYKKFNGYKSTFYNKKLRKIKYCFYNYSTNYFFKNMIGLTQIFLRGWGELLFLYAKFSKMLKKIIYIYIYIERERERERERYKEN